MSRGRAGVSAVETIVALLLLLGVLQAAWGLVRSVGAAATAVGRRAEALGGVRTAGWILEEELRGGRAGEDVSPPGADTFALRAFRGTGVVCGRDGGAVRVRYSGLRAPQPGEDSVLAFTGDGEWVPAALVRREPGGTCPGRTPGETWTLGVDLQSAVVLRLFERGSYHLADGTLRYRTGRSGRQPLTPPVFDPEESGITAAPGGRVRLGLTSRSLRGSGPGRDLARTVPLEGDW